MCIPRTAVHPCVSEQGPIDRIGDDGADVGACFVGKLNARHDAINPGKDLFGVGNAGLYIGQAPLNLCPQKVQLHDLITAAMLFDHHRLARRRIEQLAKPVLGFT